MQHLREITSDVFDIVDRLKAIDGRYRLFYNLIAKRYEVYTFTPHPTLQVVLPFSPPDARCIRHVLRTRAERISALLEEIEAENARIEREKAKAVIDKAIASAQI